MLRTHSESSDMQDTIIDDGGSSLPRPESDTQSLFILKTQPESPPPLTKRIDPRLSLTLPPGMSARKANDILHKHGTAEDPKTRTRKRTRNQRYAGGSESDDDGVNSSGSEHKSFAFIAEGTEAYKALLLSSRLRFARYFALIYEEEINEILVKVLGKPILKEESADSYDHAYEKVKRWGRQWQHETLCSITKHVKSIANNAPNLMHMTEPEVRNYFHMNMNIYSLKSVFHILAQDVDLDKIFTSPACELYCTMYCNMCFYVWQVRVKNNSGNIKKYEEKELFARFRLLAREKNFDSVRVEDIPRPPPKPVSKKRTKIGELTPLSTSDTNFRVFGLLPAASFVATQIARTFPQDTTAQQAHQNNSQTQVNYHGQQSQMSQMTQQSHDPQLFQYNDRYKEYDDSVGTQIQIPATQYMSDQRSNTFQGFAAQGRDIPQRHAMQRNYDPPHVNHQGQQNRDALLAHGAYVPDRSGGMPNMSRMNQGNSMGGMMHTTGATVPAA